MSKFYFIIQDKAMVKDTLDNRVNKHTHAHSHTQTHAQTRTHKKTHKWDETKRDIFFW